MKINVLDHGYVRLIESWGHGEAGGPQYLPGQMTPCGCDYECGIIEAARQSTQGSFRGWEDKKCPTCLGNKYEVTGAPTGESFDCRTCDGKGYLPGDARLLAFLHNNQHATPFEFAGGVLEIRGPIMVFREWHRHRTQSYNEMSARYSPLPDVNYMPTVERCMVVSGTNRQAGAVKGADELTHESALEWLEELAGVYEHCERVYQSGLKRGIPKEVARLPVPVGRYSQMRAATCLRNWLSFLTLRMDPKAQYEIRMYANAVGKIIETQFPQTWKLFDKMRTKA